MADPYELAMFPLEEPVVPGGIVPLHLFEPRYRALAHDLSEMTEPEFGGVGITRGREVGGADARADIGVVARVLELESFPDGRWSLVAGATRRIRVTQWLEAEPYPRALVHDWPDPFDPDLDAPLTALRHAVGRLVTVVRKQRPELQIAMPDGDPDDAGRSIWQLIDFAALGPLDRLDLLTCADAATRAAEATRLIAERAELLDALGND